MAVVDSGPMSPVEPQPTPVVEAAGLTKRFGPIVAVDGAELTVPAGRIVGLLGPNGSGKTTLIRLLLGLVRPDTGRVTVLGRQVPDRSLLAEVGYMPQSDGIYHELTVWENIRFFGDLYGGLGRGRAREVLELVELDDRRHSLVADLSGGMRRRLSLACALVHRPRFLVLDEPTVGVDPALRATFWHHFRELAAGGTTILVSSHVMDEADRCDELVFMRSGRIIARGSGAELRASAGTADLEAAFLHFAGLGPDGRPVGDGDATAGRHPTGPGPA
ncbi:MAG: multidrug ABC transporter ATP-binding protein [Chloroflexota bacterium]|nr:MAG: multidrug ABC transporter ATP-binding protein [Chloroflexota bacterium]